MQQTFVLLFFVVAASRAFFLQNNEIRRMLRFFPTLNDIFKEEPPYKPKGRPIRFPAPVPYRDSYFNDYHDRRDDEDSRYPNKKGHVAAHFHPSSHLDCDHPEHGYPKKLLVELADHRSKNKYENEEDFYEKRNYQTSKGKGTDNESTNYSDKSRINFKNKDYITGVLVTIPKIKQEEEEVAYVRDGKPQNAFLQSLLKTAENHHHDQERHHLPAEAVIKSYNY